MGEFEKAYSKNTGGVEKAKSDSLAQYENFLNLYTNFKMKLLDARNKNYDNNPELQFELLDYKKKVGVSYLLEKQLVEPAIAKLYDQRKYELRVSHIMIRPDSTGEEAARLKADSLLTRIKNGESFEKLVEEYTHDFYSKSAGGDIYWITAGMIVPEFEEACYSTPVGQVYPKVVQTRYGFHIIKVTAKQERIPEVKASHIMIDFYDANGAVDSVAAFATIDSVRMLLLKGELWDSLVVRYSEDQGSKGNGGDLGFFQRRMMVKEFDEAAFSLKVGQTSPIIKTAYGYHIIKLMDTKKYPSFDVEKEELKRLYKQSRYNDDLEKLTTEIKLKHNYTANQLTIDKLSNYPDTVMINSGYWESKMKKELGNITVFSFNEEKVSVDSFMNKVLNNYEFSNRIINTETIKEALKKVSGDMALDLEALILDKSFEEFASLMNDYKDGIYIFKLQDEHVWSKIELDSVRLYTYWSENKSKYKWNDRVEFAEIYAASDSVIRSYHNLLKAGENFDSLVVKYTERQGFKEKAGRFPLADVNSSELYMEANKYNVGEFSSPYLNSTYGYSIVKVLSKDAARVKTFDEAKAEVSGAFQEEESKRLEKNYLDYLKSTYKPVYYYDELIKSFKFDE
jgi:peptidyl-prolyl cis-trans isomerase SurA